MDVPATLAALTEAEALDLVSGAGMWRTAALPRLGVRALTMADGTHGLRVARDQGEAGVGAPLDAFLAAVARRADAAAADDGTLPATCFPNGSAVACCFDVDLLAEMGAALGREARALGVDILLGPGVNLRRTPLAGRAYEYYSEDPLLSGDLAAALIAGLQGEGVGACLKHFACNDSEIERTTMDSVVEERALREVHLSAFARAIAKGRPWTVMSAYNRLGGEQASESRRLLTEILRGDLGFDGLVVSDWHAVKDRPAALLAGCDLDMPENPSRRAALAAALADGRLPREVLDAAAARVLALVARADAARAALAADGAKGDAAAADGAAERAAAPAPFDADAHHALAVRLAARSAVLLRNEGDLLPLEPRPGLRLAVVGRAAVEPVIQGSGSATTRPTRVEIPLAALRDVAGPAVEVRHFDGHGADGADPAALAAAVAGVSAADVAIVFVHTEVGADGENADRRDLALAPGQDALVTALAATGVPLVVVAAMPDAVAMPWLAETRGVLAVFFAGQGMGRAVADLLFGRAEPSGRLTTTFPAALGQIPAIHTYPGENGRHVYAEGVHVGHRWYDRLGLEPLFPFGHGLSYTRFAFEGLAADRAEIGRDGALTLTVTVANTGARPGRAVVQLYAADAADRAGPVRALKGFAVVEIPAGERRDVAIPVAVADLSRYDTARGRWVTGGGAVTFHAGASSRDLPLTLEIPWGHPAPLRPIRRDTQPAFVIDRPGPRAALATALARRLALSAAEADAVIEHCRDSFFGLFTTLERRLRVTLPADEVETLLAAMNAAAEREEGQPLPYPPANFPRPAATASAEASQAGAEGAKRARR